jgi:DNA polymerase-3 subunit epsilon
MSHEQSPGFIKNYIDCFAESWTDETLTEEVRFVVLDTETTGLDPRRDRLITIGAVAVKASEMVLSDSFEALLKLAYNSSAVTVHGITREEAREGFEEPEALEEFLPYLRDGVIVGHHILHDVETLNVACQRHFGITLRNRFLDTMDLTLHLQKDGAFANQGEIQGFSLDTLCEVFAVAPHDRHTAGGDAFKTALIFIRQLHLGRRFGRTTLGALSEAYVTDDEANA